MWRSYNPNITGKVHNGSGFGSRQILPAQLAMPQSTYHMLQIPPFVLLFSWKQAACAYVLFFCFALTHVLLFAFFVECVHLFLLALDYFVYLEPGVPLSCCEVMPIYIISSCLKIFVPDYFWISLFYHDEYACDNPVCLYFNVSWSQFLD